MEISLMQTLIDDVLAYIKKYVETDEGSDLT